MTETAELERVLVNLTTAIPGVLRVYPTGPVVHTVVEEAAAAVMNHPAPLPISIAVTDGQLAVALTIGLTGAAPAADLCRHVYDVIAEHLRQKLQPVASIRVLIANIE